IQDPTVEKSHFGAKRLPLRMRGAGYWDIRCWRNVSLWCEHQPVVTTGHGRGIVNRYTASVPDAPSEVLAFDVYGTLVDPLRLDESLAPLIGDTAQPVTALWRQKQLEFTFRLVAMERYEDFASVTRKALAYALAVNGHTLDAEQVSAVLARYDALPAYPDVLSGLTRLQRAGVPMVVCSNGTPAMLSALLQHTRLGDFFQAVISVDTVGTYKPSPRVYRHIAERMGRALTEIRLVSANPFDVIGAREAGLQAAWINRSGAVFDPLGAPPDLIAPGVSALADVLITK
ncbi:MAG TPA: haloacid dehalogenase type II, partial [Chloroflexota bacterium]|nr:haloacid dehalogenase type II [Chloroflexota bacterium]